MNGYARASLKMRSTPRKVMTPTRRSATRASTSPHRVAASRSRIGEESSCFASEPVLLELLIERGNGNAEHLGGAHLHSTGEREGLFDRGPLDDFEFPPREWKLVDFRIAGVGRRHVKVVGVDDALVDESERAREHVLELSNVTGPALPAERFERQLGQSDLGAPET